MKYARIFFSLCLFFFCVGSIQSLAFPSLAQAAFTGANNKIMYATNQDGNYEIYIVNADGSNPINLTQNSAHDQVPAWSADGSRIVFSSNRGSAAYHIFSMLQDGTDVIQLTNTADNDYDPAWSPDGAQIAFKRVGGGQNWLYVMAADGSNQQQITQINGAYGPLRWSPDGAQIAYASGVSGNYEIYVINPDGTNRVNLTNTPGTDYAPDWSPDSAKIIFTSGRSGTDKVWRMNRDGSNQQQVDGSGLPEHQSAYSPDASKILFFNTLAPTSVYVMNADGSDQRFLFTAPGGNIWPNWQPRLAAPASLGSTSSAQPVVSPDCSYFPPAGRPDLFQIKTTSTTATLWFTPVGEHHNHYLITYGPVDDQERYSLFLEYTDYRGVISATINELAPNTEYYFKVRGGNNCAAGAWSNMFVAKTTLTKSALPALFYYYD